MKSCPIRYQNVDIIQNKKQKFATGFFHTFWNRGTILYTMNLKILLRDYEFILSYDTHEITKLLCISYTDLLEFELAVIKDASQQSPLIISKEMTVTGYTPQHLHSHVTQISKHNVGCLFSFPVIWFLKIATKF